MDCRDHSLLHDLAVTIHNGSMIEEDFSNWFSRLLFIIPKRNGGITFTVDPHNPKIIWFDGYHPGYLPRRKTCNAVAFLIMSMKFKYLATYTENKRLHKYHLLMGMQQVSDNIFSLCLQYNKSD